MLSTHESRIERQHKYAGREEWLGHIVILKKKRLLGLILEIPVASEPGFVPVFTSQVWHPKNTFSFLASYIPKRVPPRDRKQ